MPRLISGAAHSRLTELAQQGMKTTALRRQLRAEGIPVSNQAVSDALKAYRGIQERAGDTPEGQVTRLRHPIRKGAEPPNFKKGSYYYYGEADVEKYVRGEAMGRETRPLMFGRRDLLSYAEIDATFVEILEKGTDTLIDGRGLGEDTLDELIAEAALEFDYFTVLYTLQITSVVQPM